MTPYLRDAEANPNHPDATTTNTLLAGTHAALQQLLAKTKENLPQEAIQHILQVNFSTANTGSPYFPSPLKQTEAISALKAVEAGIASTIAGLREDHNSRKINVDLERATAFLFSTYLATVGGFDKSNPKAQAFLKGWQGIIINHCYRSDRGQTRICYRHNQSYIEGCLPICMKPRILGSIFTFMAPWKRPKHLTWSDWKATDQI